MSGLSWIILITAVGYTSQTMWKTGSIVCHFGLRHWISWAALAGVIGMAGIFAFLFVETLK